MRDVKVLLLMTYPTNFISVDLDESVMGMMSTRYTDREEVAAIGGERRGEGMAEGRGCVRRKDRLQRAGVTNAAVPPVMFRKGLSREWARSIFPAFP